MVEPLPRATDEDGHLAVSVHTIRGYLGSEAEISPQGNLRTVTPTRLVGSAFAGNTLDTNFWSTAGSSGSGGATQSGGRVAISTGSTPDSTARMTSVRMARYVAGASTVYRAVLTLPEVTGNNKRRWGAYTDTDGFFFEDDFSDGANHVLKLVCRKGSSDENVVTSGSFNGDQGNAFTLDANVHSYEIYITNSKVFFVISDQLVHTFEGTTDPLSSTLTLPARVESINAGGNTNDNAVHLRVASISRLGPLHTEAIYKNVVGSATSVLKLGAGVLLKLIVNNAPSNGTITIYDNTAASGTLIATVTLSNTATSPLVLPYECPFFTGLTVVTSGTGLNITAIYE
jgi:hypothetical protein